MTRVTVPELKKYLFVIGSNFTYLFLDLWISAYPFKSTAIVKFLVF